MAFNFIRKNIPLLSLSLVLFIGSIPFPTNTYASSKEQESDISNTLRAHDIEAGERSDDVDFYVENIRTHMGGATNEKLQNVLENIEIVTGAKSSKIGKDRLIGQSQGCSAIPLVL